MAEKLLQAVLIMALEALLAVTPTALGGAHENSDDRCSWFRRWLRWSDCEYRPDTIDQGSAGRVSERAAIERTNSE